MRSCGKGLRVLTHLRWLAERLRSFSPANYAGLQDDTTIFRAW